MSIDSRTHGEMTSVRLRGVPVRLRQESLQHFEELLREMQLVLQGMEQGSARAVPERLIELTAEVRSVYGAFTSRPGQELDDAFDRGERAVDEVVFTVPAAAVELAGHLTEALAEVDEYCRGGALLTLSTPEALVAYRSWFLGEFGRQAAGEEPLPWPAYAAARGRDADWHPLPGQRDGS